MMCLIVFSSHSEKAEDLIEKSEDDVVVGDITRFVKEFKMDVERKNLNFKCLHGCGVWR